MTYNDIGTPIKKTLFGEADIIYTFLTAHTGKIDAIAKGIRKSTSRKRGNIELGIFSSLQFAKGKNLDVVIEAQMLEYNIDLLEAKGVRFLYNILPLVNRFSTDKEHSIKIFESLKKVFITFDPKEEKRFELEIRYMLLDIQNLLPDFNQCSICRLKFENLDKYSIKSGFMICNNCARKFEYNDIKYPKKYEDIESYNEKDSEILKNILDIQIKNIL